MRTDAHWKDLQLAPGLLDQKYPLASVARRSGQRLKRTWADGDFAAHQRLLANNKTSGVPERGLLCNLLIQKVFGECAELRRSA